MKLAYSSNAYVHHTLVEAIERVAALAYDGVEIMADVPHAWPADISDVDLIEIRHTLDRLSLGISNVNAFMMKAEQDFWHPSWIEPDAGYRRKRVDHTKNALKMASVLGAPSITTEPGGPLEPAMSRERAMDVFVSGLEEALECAEDVGVDLLVEPEPGLLIERADQFLELSGCVESPRFGLNFDVGHFFCVGENLPDAVRRLAPWTRHYHFEDIAASRVHEHLVPGTGAIEFAPLIEAIRETEYHGWLTVELYPFMVDPDGAGRAAREFLQPLLTVT